MKFKKRKKWLRIQIVGCGINKRTKNFEVYYGTLTGMFDIACNEFKFTFHCN